MVMPDKRREERLMASENGGHISQEADRALNKCENPSKQTNRAAKPALASIVGRPLDSRRCDGTYTDTAAEFAAFKENE
ncbi:hypothetical protein [Caballeronia arvi]|uniref:hypothetical protein n=1 Tax=Caballeronia arvi TaxID=1777135 RepID=UPI001F261D05|nr:hypothetical protein [Caballeronia arvi]